jgi:hypothetical protein
MLRSTFTSIAGRNRAWKTKNSGGPEQFERAVEQSNSTGYPYSCSGAYKEVLGSRTFPAFSGGMELPLRHSAGFSPASPSIIQKNCFYYTPLSMTRQRWVYVNPEIRELSRKRHREKPDAGLFSTLRACFSTHSLSHRTVLYDSVANVSPKRRISSNFWVHVGFVILANEHHPGRQAGIHPGQRTCHVHPDAAGDPGSKITLIDIFT